ncbi:hypothetical protein GJ496_000801 [Pomphorhynchus laevis]|nr:hypothetical protein GJ496_000801 [Pomphorhynchus laevis]
MSDKINSKKICNIDDDETIDIIAISDGESETTTVNNRICNPQSLPLNSDQISTDDHVRNRVDIHLPFDTVHIGSIICSHLQPADVIFTGNMFRFSSNVDNYNSVTCKFLYTDLLLIVTHMSSKFSTLIVFISSVIRKMITDQIFPLLITGDDLNSYSCKSDESKNFASIAFTVERRTSGTFDCGPVSHKHGDWYISKLMNVLRGKVRFQIVSEDKAKDLLSRLIVKRNPIMVEPSGTASPSSHIDAYTNGSRNDDNLQESSSILIYPKTGSNRISITSDDLRCLIGNAFLNDVIIGFYCRYLYNELSTERQKHIYHIFDSIFFDKLLATNFQIRSKPETISERFNNLRKWAKTLNLGEKHFLFFPANQNFHWFLVILCFPCILFQNDDSDISDLTEYTDCKPMLLILDSLNQRDDIFSDYVIDRYKTSTVVDAVENAMFTFLQCFAGISADKYPPVYELRVPKQNNYTDCGLFVLEYLKEFVRENPLKILTDPPPDLSNWFDSSKIECTRSHIHKLIENQIDKDA